MRENWKSRKGFIFAAVGAAIGLGNLWRFPFQAYKNGGGAFLLPYFIALITCAIPLMIMEHAYGRKIRGGSVKAFAKLKKKLEIIGWIQVMVPIIVMTYYSTIIAVAVVFMFFSLGHAFGIINWLSNPGPIMGMVTGSAKNALDFGAGISIYILIAVIAVWICNWLIVKKGIAFGIEKMSMFFTPILMVLMIIFMINAINLDGAAIGLEALFKPDFSKILNPSIWVSAYAQVFFSTTLAVGVMIAYGSYLNEKADIVNSAIITVLANASFDLIAGVLVFSTLGHLVNSMGVKFTSFGTGAGVAFMAFPIAISTMSTNIVVQGLLGFLFFFCLFIAGLSSSISMLESFTTAALDKFDISREKLVLIISIVGFCGSACFASYAGFNYILDIVDAYVGNIVIAGLGLVEVILISYFYGTSKLRQEANAYSDFKVGIWWDYLLKYFTPLLLGAVVVTNIFNLITELFSKNKVEIVSSIIFGWGTVVLMILASIVLYRKKWTSKSQEVKSLLTNNDVNEEDSINR
ncbi:sodium-dependent transporter [Clostridium estertheticum]|uniref:sodium-dependent transporter n=1 Tax=Clostridium estertheticum TaxID=238834 RepID=UPI001C6EE1FD|nr:sodium-dependent transporter [Clostridium estertheticum]MBW9151088.1 sodium-dependent transporter [Clostridium estertheticum]WLC84910.1 sodium-dependent transporter [Clostridium estertheticum]